MISQKILRQQKLFSDLPPELLERISQGIQLKSYQKKEMVIRKGAASDALLLVLTGRLQVVSISEKGKEVGINFIEEGDYFGELGLIDGGPRSASVTAITTSSVGLLPKSQALWLFENNPMIAGRIQKRLCEIIRKEINYRSSLSGAKAYTRIYSVVFSNAAKAASGATDSAVIENLPSQESIASMANVSRETVSRALSTLIKAGIVKKDTHRLIVLNPQLFEKLAKGELEPAQLSPAAQNFR